jgi:adenine-specific DNA-methyltransferase
MSTATVQRSNTATKPRTARPVALPLPGVPQRALEYPELRYMGSKKRLLPWLHHVLDGLDFESALDPFSGTGCVSYLMKSMDRRVIASDFLDFTSLIARATVETGSRQLDPAILRKLLARPRRADDFIARTYDGIFYKPEDLRFLDAISHNIRRLPHAQHQALAYAALFRSCLKRQPRGVFTVSGNLDRYDDGRRDLQLSIQEHFIEQVQVFNAAVFDNGRRNKAQRADVFELAVPRVDLVYLDPPYVPRSDDNCYIKRYHFLEGLASYWEGLPVDMTTKVRKIKKRFTPFSYRHSAVEAFDRMFARFARSIMVLSYSSNGYPDLDQLVALMERHKRTVRVFERPHRYHFGTHDKVNRASVTEYLIVGQ